MSEHIAIVPIRYDGLDAEKHQIELHLLGESLRGLSRILAVSGHFLVTQKYAKQYQALDVAQVLCLEFRIRQGQEKEGPKGLGVCRAAAEAVLGPAGPRFGPWDINRSGEAHK